MAKLKYYIPGGLLVMMALLILAVPEILVAFVAAAVAMSGISLLYLGHMMRKADTEWSAFERARPYAQFFRAPGDDWFGCWF